MPTLIKWDWGTRSWRRWSGGFGTGLDAVECYYPKHTPEQTAFYLRLAEKYGLHVTGGSDFHGERVKPDVHLMAWELDLSWLLDG